MTTPVSPEEFQGWLDTCDRVRFARVSKSLADDEQIVRYLPANYQVVESCQDYVIIAGADVAGWTLDKHVLPALSSGLITGRELQAVKAEVYHNISRDAYFGLNTVFRPNVDPKNAKREAATDEERHPLVKVFEYVTYLDFDLNVCERAFAAFNNGSNREDQRYFGRRLRSLSVGDVITIDGEPYSCENAGFKERDRSELRIVTDFDPQSMYGNQAITVPWKGGE